MANVDGYMHLVTKGRGSSDESWSTSAAPYQVHDTGNFSVERATTSSPWRIRWFGGGAISSP